MPIEPFSWNAVVLGAWNTAILAPDGVRRRLFELPEGTPIEIEIAVDAPGPFRVGHDGILVVPASDRLEVAARVSNEESLLRACTVCTRALRSLPETPVSAVGINIRYRFTDFPEAVLDLLSVPLDAALSDAGFQVAGATIKRTLALAPGVVNVQIAHAEGAGTLEFNFHRDSRIPNELVDWLARAEEFVHLSDRLAAVVGAADVRREIHA